MTDPKRTSYRSTVRKAERRKPGWMKVVYVAGRSPPWLDEWGMAVNKRGRVHMGHGYRWLKEKPERQRIAQALRNAAKLLEEGRRITYDDE